MQELYSVRTRKEVKELRKEEQREERNKRFVKNLPFIILFLGILISIISYAIFVSKQYDEMREKIVNDRDISISIRKKYMTQDELRNIMYGQNK